MEDRLFMLREYFFDFLSFLGLSFGSIFWSLFSAFVYLFFSL